MAGVQYFDTVTNEWISTIPKAVQEAQRHVPRPAEFFSVGVLCFKEGALEGPRSQRLPSRLYKKLKGTLILLMRDMRHQTPAILYCKNASPHVVDALKDEKIIQSTYAMIEWEDASGAGLSTLLMWNIRYTASSVKHLETRNSDEDEDGASVLPYDINAQVVFLRGIVQGAPKLAILSAHVNQRPSSTNRSTPMSSTSQSQMDSSTTSESSSDPRAEHLATWKALHSIGSDVMNTANNVMIISNITDAAHSVTFEDPQVPPGLNGSDSLKLRGIAEPRAMVTLFTMGSHVAPRRLSPFITTKLHSRPSMGSVDLMLCAKVFTVGLPPQEGGGGCRKVSGIQPPQAIGVGQKAKPTAQPPSATPIPPAPTSSETQQKPVELPKTRWTVSRSVSLNTESLRPREQLFDLTQFTSSMEALVTVLNKGDSSDKPLAIGMDVSVLVDPQSHQATEIHWPFSYAIYNQKLLVESHSSENLAVFKSYAEDHKKISDAKKQLERLFAQKNQQPISAISSPIAPIPLAPLAATEAEVPQVNPYTYSVAQPPMDALRAAQREAQQRKKQRQHPSSPSNPDVSSFPRRRRQWNINHSILLFQMSPIEAQLDISSQIGVMRNALASAVSRLNGHAEPQENAVPALRAAIQAERSKASPTASPSPIEHYSEEPEPSGDRLSISSHRRSGLLDVINLSGESGVVDPLVSFPYDYALIYSQELEAYWMLAATDVPCDVAVCQAYVRRLEEATRV